MRFFTSLSSHERMDPMKLFNRPSPIVFRDAPSLSLTLPDEASLWCYGTMVEYFPDRISFRSERFVITLLGDGLSVRAMSQSEVLVSGRLTGVDIREVTA